MISFPNAKINLGLNVIEKRTDGFHNIESVFYPIKWCDVLEIIPSETFKFQSTGLPIPGNPNSNLIIKAFNVLRENGYLTDKQQVSIFLHKILPMGAGIGGGSADGAFALNLINDIFELNLPINTLQNFAAQLGSDCPFFIQNKPMFCFGKGTEFEDIALNLKWKYVVLVNPQIHISTAEAYAGVTPQKPKIALKEIIKSPISDWKNVLVNDFEASILKNHPKIAQIKNKLYDIGAQYASMTGSGSTVYGIFEEEVLELNSQFLDCFCWQGNL
jgi:4-diphosphocytidyl-2-C-methyl-D-erythritol kinase